MPVARLGKVLREFRSVALKFTSSENPSGLDEILSAESRNLSSSLEKAADCMTTAVGSNVLLLTTSVKVSSITPVFISSVNVESLTGERVGSEIMLIA